MDNSTAKAEQAIAGVAPKKPLPIAAWLWIKDLATTFKPCRFSVLVVLIGSFALIFVPQCQEALRGLAERDEVPELVWKQWTTFFIAAVLWAFNAWYWARQMLHLHFPNTPALTPRRILFRRYVPRALGIGALLSVTIALWKGGRVYHDINHAAAAQLTKAVWAALALTILFGLFVFFRRRIFKVPTYRSNQPEQLKDLDRSTWWLLLGSAALAFSFFLTFWLAPLEYAALIGAPAILLFAAATWIPLGSFLVYLGSRYQFPFLSLLMIAAAIFSFWNDDHALRSTPGALPPPITIEASAEEWLSARAEDLRANHSPSNRYPVFVVAAAGGGIRAAYWTASLLSALEDRYPDTTFSKHTFAISGVSGGSLGAATFVALTAHNARTPLPGCRQQSAGNIRPCADAVLSQDFLAPALASMLYPDLTQRFLPFSIASFDRARVLEGSWEQAWQGQGMPADQLAQPLHSLWNDDKARTLPLLFLNSTVVETGQRAIVSTVTVGNYKGFGDALDVVALTQAPMPLSSAAHLSARFTYMSPAASIFDANHKLRGHLVDGGYFENSGGTTAQSILGVLDAAARKLKLEDNISLWVIVIGNSPGYIADGASELKPQRFMMEALSPIEAVINARDARGRHAEANVAQFARPFGGDALLFGLEPSEVPLPLGWMLSDSAQHEIDRQTEALMKDPSKNKSMTTIDLLLGNAKQNK